MTLFMTPVSFNSIDIDGTLLGGGGRIYSSAFRLPAQRVQSKITQVAGDVLIDFDYGNRATRLPAPFAVSFLFEGQTAANLRFTIDLLLEQEAGESGLFVAKLHGLSTEYSCTAQMQAPILTVTGRNLGPNTLKYATGPITFVPVDAFTVVT